MTAGLFAQNKNYDVAIDSFQANYNAKNYDKIFNSFSTEMQQALPIENTRQFFTNLINGVGIMENKEFVKKEQGSIAVYKAQFERAVLGIYISLDNQNKIGSILIKPYQEKTDSKSQSFNALNTYPKEIAATIFEKVKAFPNKTQLSIAIIKNNKTEYYGIIKQNDTIKAIENQNKIFEIGSITKVFTATVLASLVTKGKIKLNDNINSYYPFSFNNNIQLSFESLANHTSGYTIERELLTKDALDLSRRAGMVILRDTGVNGTFTPVIAKTEFIK